MNKQNKTSKGKDHVYTFARVENKYILSSEQYEKIKKIFDEQMILDAFGKTTICNIYYDNDEYELMRTSIDKPIYKEKLRLRSYNIPNENSQVFLEIKKKFDGIVYKRRISTTLANINENIKESSILNNADQITKEIKYCVEHYDLKPKIYISYVREAYFNKDNTDFRITLDRELLGRKEQLDLCKGSYGEYILDKNSILMEVKSDLAYPEWFIELLNNSNIYPISFSKVGTYYKEFVLKSKNEQKLNEIPDLSNEWRKEKCLVAY